MPTSTLRSSTAATEIVQALLNAGSDPQAKDPERKTARDYAVAGGHTQVVELLDARARQGAGKGKR